MSFFQAASATLLTATPTPHLRRASTALLQTNQRHKILHGSTSGSTCSSHDTCSDCVRSPGCGFCGSTETCMEGNDQGTFSPSGCDSGWRMVECDDLAPCSSFGTCEDCLRGARCGWCPSTLNRTREVGCYSMVLVEGVPASTDKGQDATDAAAAATQWMPPQQDGWCPGGTYQHKYKEQCKSGQPSKEEALRSGKRLDNARRAEEYTDNIASEGDEMQRELASLLAEIHREHEELEKDSEQSANATNVTDFAAISFYTSSNATKRLLAKEESALEKYRTNNRSYYEQISSIATPGNATSEDTVVQEQRERLENATVARSQSRDAYTELETKLAVR